ncbi:MAG: tRNA (guanosine(37)-N1)-methyltransferase TrmD [Spirochaetes bacterium]|nr:tRNA (guanosine(37)-N1)-methyltransferase TrmD [Spirochaetota bacterium]
MTVTILTLFPDFFTSPFSTGVIAGAKERDLLHMNIVNLRDYSADAKHHKCDDYPYGGGPGMVMSVEPFMRYYEVHPKQPKEHTVLLAPSGAVMTQPVVKRLSGYERLTLIAGHYEGVDGRVETLYADETLSIGDYVLSGGEPAAMVVIDALVRYFGVLGNDASVPSDTFEAGLDGLLEYEQYTRPPDAAGHMVNAGLRGGDHRVIERWRRQRSVLRTFRYRSDLLAQAKLDADDVRTIFDYLIDKE